MGRPSCAEEVAAKERPPVVKVKDHVVDPDKAQTISDELVHDRVEGEADAEPDEPPVMICRPKPGEMTMGACYVGIWRKIPDSERT